MPSPQIIKPGYATDPHWVVSEDIQQGGAGEDRLDVVSKSSTSLRCTKREKGGVFSLSSKGGS